MGAQEQPQSSLFHIGVNPEKRIRNNHPLRKTKELVNFHFVYFEVKSFYGHNDNESVPSSATLDDIRFRPLRNAGLLKKVSNALFTFPPAPKINHRFILTFLAEET